MIEENGAIYDTDPIIRLSGEETNTRCVHQWYHFTFRMASDSGACDSYNIMVSLGYYEESMSDPDGNGYISEYAY